MIQLLRNARLTAATIQQHLLEDPMVLFLQLSRRLPAAVRPLAGAVVRKWPAGSTAGLVSFLALVSGNDAEMDRRIRLAAAAAIPGPKARRLAEIALAANRPDLADLLMDRACAARNGRATAARRLWHDGAVSDALAVWDGASGPEPLQQRRLKAEAAVLRGAAPVLASVPFQPVEGRVLHLLTNSLPHTASGYAQRSHSTLLAQQAGGKEVLAVTRMGYPVQVGKVLAKGQDLVEGITYRRLLPGRMAATVDARLQQQAEELLKVALEFRPGVLHTTTHYVNGMVVRAVADALGIPWVYEVRGQLADTWASVRGPEARESEKYRLFSQREREAMLSASLVLTLGVAMKSNIVAAGVPAAKVLLMPNAVGGDFLDEPRSQADARRELGLPVAGQYVGTVSSLVPYEGIHELMQAFVLLAGDHPDLNLLIVGDGVSTPSLRAQAEQSDFADRIIFTGRVPQKLAVRYHQALDIFAVPRKDLEVTRSVTPLKPVEAMACARPVVATDLPALREIVEPGVTGLLTEPGNPGALAAGLRTLLNDPGLAAELGRAGRERVLNERTWAANAAALSKELEKLGVTNG
ncbi:hypothetical protein ACU18_15590 [Arthrobacter sp. ZBG10]|uniref:glycosyltransferase n=1 Tax=Arthrobacter sp. ZBG10 TaxID=1676590 RepID=UPI00068310DE|nr:glycosyltransferase [Arthrobacter sp. ZBG10]KNH15847.1 hypothetical protein ACU18_15590 [Arthrobacter sp. ZBG10]